MATTRATTNGFFPLRAASVASGCRRRVCLVKGGQGRTPQRLIEDAAVIGICGGVCVVAVIVLLVSMLTGA